MSPWPPPASNGAPVQGWYPDPWTPGGLRWFDGRAWTGQLATATKAPEPDPTFPLVAAWWGLAVFAATTVLVRPVSSLLAGSLPAVLAVVLLIGSFYAPLVAYCAWASRRWGTGRMSDDFGLRGRPLDLAWGLAALASSYAAQIAVAAVLLVTRVPLSSNTEGVQELSDERAVYLAFAAGAVLAAPFVEELFCRGLLLRSFRSRWSAPLAIGLQGALFGLFHADPLLGWGNIGLVLLLATVGSVWGIFAHVIRRLGPTMVAHALMNAVVFVVLLVTA